MQRSENKQWIPSSVLLLFGQHVQQKLPIYAFDPRPTELKKKRRSTVMSRSGFLLLAEIFVGSIVQPTIKIFSLGYRIDFKILDNTWHPRVEGTSKA